MKLALIFFIFLICISAYSEQYIVTCKPTKGLGEEKMLTDCIEKIKKIKDLEKINPKKFISSITGFVAELNDKQVSILKIFKDVEGVVVDKKIFTSATKSPITTFDESYTWGLTKIKIPESRTTYPIILGTNVVVGVVDSGILGTHQEFTGKIQAWKDFTGNQVIPFDDCGHGTHVAGTIVGGNSSGQNIGVAPNAKLVVAKVLFLDFFQCSGYESDIVLGMQWMANYDGLGSKVSIVNMSLGRDRDLGEAPDLATDVFHKAITYLARKGILVVTAAGNAGPNTKTVGFPASSPASLTVGSIDSTNTIANSSSRGPADWTRLGSLYVFPKPEIVAPGVGVYSAYSTSNTAYATMNGTSMAAPHITGIAALIKQVKPGITVNNIIKTMQRFAVPLPDSGNSPNNNYGRGLVDVKKILDACISSSRTDDCTDLVPRPR